jgi:hypothetical protein
VLGPPRRLRAPDDGDPTVLVRLRSLGELGGVDGAHPVTGKLPHLPALVHYDDVGDYPCYSLCYVLLAMASRTVRARLDPRSEADLDLLMRDGGTESEAVRSALAEAAARRRRRSALRAEVARLATDPDDRRAREEALSDLDGLEAPWPS